MTVVDRVIVHHSMSTLVLITLILLVAVFYETALGWSRRELIQVLSARLDAKLNLHVFNKLLGLSLDYFERNQAGQITYRLFAIYRVRDFITGKLLTTFLDAFTLLVLLPVLFYLDATLAWIVLGVSFLIAMVIFAFLPAMRRIIGKVVARGDREERGAGRDRARHPHRQVAGPRAAAARRLGPEGRHRRSAAAAGRPAGELAQHPGHPARDVRAARRDPGRRLSRPESGDPVAVGGLVAFMMLGGRVAQPLTGMARLLEDLEEVRAAVGEVGLVVNNPPESADIRRRPASKIPRRHFVRGRQLLLSGVQDSGSQEGYLPGAARHHPWHRRPQRLRQVDHHAAAAGDLARLRGLSEDRWRRSARNQPAHLRRSFGVVLQDNFLFRGTVRDNITAGRPGLILEDAVRAARLAGAEEFIERMPQGYETFIEEGSTNISGGQRQRLAIARAVICDPRILILDEATSALDPESEALVNANLLRIASGRTMVVVSHRLSSLTECDQILVLDRGEVMDMAPHLELVERCEVYRTLWQQQNRHLHSNGPRDRTVGPVLAQGDD